MKITRARVKNGRLRDSAQHYRVSYVYGQRSQPLPNASISMKSDLYCIHRAIFEPGVNFAR